MARTGRAGVNSALALEAGIDGRDRRNAGACSPTT